MKIRLRRIDPGAVIQTFCFTLLLAFTLSSATFAQQQSLQKVRVLCLNRPLPAVAAQSQGIFAKYGIALELTVEQGSDVLRKDLAAGKGDVAYLALDNAVAMVVSGGADVVIVMGGESSQNELIVQPEIKSVKDLRGRRVLVDAPNTAYALQLKKVLLLNGLQPESDVSLDPIGSTQFRLKAMTDDKQNAASMLYPPFSILAKHAGLASLGTMQKLLGGDQDRGTFALRSWASSHADLLERYLAGYVQGQRWLVARSNRASVVAMVMRESNLTEPIAEAWYATVVQAGGYARDAQFNLRNFKHTLQLRAEVEGGENKMSPAAEKYLDLSYYHSALSKVKKSPR